MASKISKSVGATLKVFQTCRSVGKKLPPTDMIKINITEHSSGLTAPAYD
jgi:hypothetical protein